MIARDQDMPAGVEGRGGRGLGRSQQQLLGELFWQKWSRLDCLGTDVPLFSCPGTPLPSVLHRREGDWLPTCLPWASWAPFHWGGGHY